MVRRGQWNREWRERRLCRPCTGRRGPPRGKESVEKNHHFGYCYSEPVKRRRSIVIVRERRNIEEKKYFYFKKSQRSNFSVTFLKRILKY